jgi:hypothetical protein
MKISGAAALRPAERREIGIMKGCRRCTYWHGLGELLDRDDPAIVGRKVELGLCRRYAPKPGTDAQTAQTGNGQDCFWPKVASDDWCGEWQPDVT